MSNEKIIEKLEAEIKKLRNFIILKDSVISQNNLLIDQYKNIIKNYDLQVREYQKIVDELNDDYSKVTTIAEIMTQKKIQLQDKIDKIESVKTFINNKN